MFRAKTIITDIDYNKFTKKTFIDKIPFIGKGLSAWTTLGIYSNVFIEEWIEELLRKKVFIYLLIYHLNKLKIIASDISNGKMVVFPDDLPNYGF